MLAALVSALLLPPALLALILALDRYEERVFGPPPRRALPPGATASGTPPAEPASGHRPARLRPSFGLARARRPRRAPRRAVTRRRAGRPASPRPPEHRTGDGRPLSGDAGVRAP
ncbi:hypothetical protein [Streptomyces caatingaensis]|uniref:Uncharacterized protein n=1 Tax=Streptomyces caatingaensis TaxID=1678637 RepID=A0A0K9XKW0_9ACTN|nr:hypothetical protein [Streptomyces caatingaensis]KNB54024.1 hypothetical protein AC230_05610 [Streptomyces caatingaensis]